MATISRRAFLATAGATAGMAATADKAEATTDGLSFSHATAKLYDATRCIGCRSCLRACRTAHRLPPDPVEVEGVRYDLPEQLSTNSWLVIQAYREEADPESGQEGRWSFIKKSCMHCNVPACVSACPVVALEKTEQGPVLYHEDRCIGCRYCLLACPFQVPRYEWVKNVPRVRKCDLNLACVHACPVEALVTGTRGELVEEAHRRIREHRGRYVEHVYGEHEAGGTSYLILSGVPLEKLGLPKLSSAVRSTYAEAVLHSIPGLIIGMGLFLGGLYQLEKWQRRVVEKGKQVGVKDQNAGEGKAADVEEENR